MLELYNITFSSTSASFSSTQNKLIKFSFKDCLAISNNVGKVIDKSTIEWKERIRITQVYAQAISFEIYNQHTFGYTAKDLSILNYGTVILRKDNFKGKWEIYSTQQQNKVIGYLSFEYKKASDEVSISKNEQSSNKKIQISILVKNLIKKPENGYIVLYNKSRPLKGPKVVPLDQKDGQFSFCLRLSEKYLKQNGMIVDFHNEGDDRKQGRAVFQTNNWEQMLKASLLNDKNQRIGDAYINYQPDNIQQESKKVETKNIKRQDNNRKVLVSILVKDLISPPQDGYIKVYNKNRPLKGPKVVPIDRRDGQFFYGLCLNQNYLKQNGMIIDFHESNDKKKGRAVFETDNWDEMVKASLLDQKNARVGDAYINYSSEEIIQDEDQKKYRKVREQQQQNSRNKILKKQNNRLQQLVQNKNQVLNKEKISFNGAPVKKAIIKERQNEQITPISGSEKQKNGQKQSAKNLLKNQNNLLSTSPSNTGGQPSNVENYNDIPKIKTSITRILAGEIEPSYSNTNPYQNPGETISTSRNAAPVKKRPNGWNQLDQILQNRQEENNSQGKVTKTGQPKKFGSKQETTKLKSMNNKNNVPQNLNSSFAQAQSQPKVEQQNSKLLQKHNDIPKVKRQIWKILAGQADPQKKYIDQEEQNKKVKQQKISLGTNKKSIQQGQIRSFNVAPVKKNLDGKNQFLDSRQKNIQQKGGGEVHKLGNNNNQSSQNVITPNPSYIEEQPSNIENYNDIPKIKTSIRRILAGEIEPQYSSNNPQKQGDTVSDSRNAAPVKKKPNGQNQTIIKQIKDNKQNDKIVDDQNYKENKKQEEIAIKKNAEPVKKSQPKEEIKKQGQPQRSIKEEQPERKHAEPVKKSQPKEEIKKQGQPQRSIKEEQPERKHQNSLKNNPIVSEQPVIKHAQPVKKSQTKKQQKIKQELVQNIQKQLQPVNKLAEPLKKEQIKQQYKQKDQKPIVKHAEPVKKRQPQQYQKTIQQQKLKNSLNSLKKQQQFQQKKREDINQLREQQPIIKHAEPVKKAQIIQVQKQKQKLQNKNHIVKNEQPNIKNKQTGKLGEPKQDKVNKEEQPQNNKSKEQPVIKHVDSVRKSLPKEEQPQNNKSKEQLYKNFSSKVKNNELKEVKPLQSVTVKNPTTKQETVIRPKEDQPLNNSTQPVKYSQQNQQKKQKQMKIQKNTKPLGQVLKKDVQTNKKRQLQQIKQQSINNSKQKQNNSVDQPKELIKNNPKQQERQKEQQLLKNNQPQQIGLVQKPGEHMKNNLKQDSKLPSDIKTQPKYQNKIKQDDLSKKSQQKDNQKSINQQSIKKNIDPIKNKDQRQGNEANVQRPSQKNLAKEQPPIYKQSQLFKESQSNEEQKLIQKQPEDLKNKLKLRPQKESALQKDQSKYQQLQNKKIKQQLPINKQQTKNNQKLRSQQAPQNKNQKLPKKVQQKKQQPLQSSQNLYDSKQYFVEPDPLQQLAKQHHPQGQLVTYKINIKQQKQKPKLTNLPNYQPVKLKKQIEKQVQRYKLRNSNNNHIRSITKSITKQDPKQPNNSKISEKHKTNGSQQDYHQDPKRKYPQNNNQLERLARQNIPNIPSNLVHQPKQKNLNQKLPKQNQNKHIDSVKNLGKVVEKNIYELKDQLDKQRKKKLLEQTLSDLQRRKIQSRQQKSERLSRDQQSNPSSKDLQKRPQRKYSIRQQQNSNTPDEIQNRSARRPRRNYYNQGQFQSQARSNSKRQSQPNEENKEDHKKIHYMMSSQEENERYMYHLNQLKIPKREKKILSYKSHEEMEFQRQSKLPLSPRFRVHESQISSNRSLPKSRVRQMMSQMNQYELPRQNGGSLRKKYISQTKNNKDIVFSREPRFKQELNKKEHYQDVISYLKLPTMDFYDRSSGRYYKGASIGKGKRIDITQASETPGVGEYRLPPVYDHY